jgi:hypothetical protein
MSKPVANINLSDDDLFGNEVAEDEDQEIFGSYALKRDELVDFSDPDIRIRIARAYKGEGKSALLRLVRIGLPDEAIVVSTNGPSLSPSFSSGTSTNWIRSWKEQIYRTIVAEFGARIGLAMGDDAMSLVEESEKSGSRKRNFVGALLSRITTSSLPKYTSQGAINPEKLVSRWKSKHPPLWFIVDDIDQNFANDRDNKDRIAGFFTACREVVAKHPDIHFRLTVRPHVWTILKREFDSLSHVEQYIADLRWSQEQIRDLLALRIEGYLKRHGQEQILGNLKDDAWPRSETLIGFAFDSPMTWDKRNRPPHVVLSTLSRYRPRWVIELCKTSAKRASYRKHSVITLSDIEETLAEFGKRRIDDTIAEFRSQCPEVEELISAFVDKPKAYSTDELLKLIENRIINHLNPKIAGVTGKPTNRDVGAFLFEIGFLSARRDFSDQSYEHIHFAENPSLLRARSNVDQGVTWEIHPVFRQALGLRDPERRRSTNRR